MRILIISQYYTPDITAAAFRISETVELLKAAGHDVRVITAVPHKSEMKADSDRDRANCVSRVPLLSGDRGGVLRYLGHYFSFVVGSSAAGLVLRLGSWKPDIIWASSPPLFVGLTGWLLARLNCCPLVFDIRDIWPQSAVAAGQISGGGYAFRLGAFLEKWLYESSDHITCVSKEMARYIENRSAVPVTVIYNGVSKQHAANAPENVDSHRILYAGNLGRAQALDVVIRAFARSVSEGLASDYVLEFIGAGVLKAELEGLALSLGVEERVRFHAPVTKEMAMKELRRSALLLISLKGDDVFDLTIPSKVFDYMSVGRPVLFGINGEGRRLLESTGANVAFLPGNEDSLCDAFADSVRRYEDLDKLAFRNALAISEVYSRGENVKKLIDVFEATIEARE